jgi:hypothetical protein
MITNFATQLTYLYTFNHLISENVNLDLPQLTHHQNHHHHHQLLTTADEIQPLFLHWVQLQPKMMKNKYIYTSNSFKCVPYFSDYRPLLFSLISWLRPILHMRPIYCFIKFKNLKITCNWIQIWKMMQMEIHCKSLSANKSWMRPIYFFFFKIKPINRSCSL